MTIERFLEEAKKDRARTEALTREHGSPSDGAAADDEEAFVRAVLAGADDAKIVDAVLRADERAAASTALEPAREARRARRGRGPLYYVGGALALAAAVALFLRAGGESAPLPEYALALSGGDAPDRSKPVAQATVVSRGARLEISAAPTTAAETSVDARLFARCGDGAWRAVTIEARVAGSGAVRFEGTTEQIFDEARGSCALGVVVVPSGAKVPLPSEAGEHARAIVRQIVVK
jgi:hypothetical protein